jgi:hypothetical protein
MKKTWSRKSRVRLPVKVVVHSVVDPWHFGTVQIRICGSMPLANESGSETNFRSDPVGKRDPKLLFRICNTEITGFVINFAPRCGYGSVNQDYRSADPDLKEIFMDPQQQSSGSVTFWNGSGSLDLDPWIRTLDYISRSGSCLYWNRIRITNYLRIWIQIHEAQKLSDL